MLTGLLEDSTEDDRELLGSVVGDLLDLDAVEAAPAMERAFAEDRVDLSAAGDWEDVQVELGLLPARITPTRNYFLEAFPGLAEVADLLERRAPGPVSVRESRPVASRGDGRNAAAKRKREKEARRKNRRRK